MKSKQPFENCKIVCGNEPCHSRGMCYTQMYILEKAKDKLANYSRDKDNK